MTDQTVRIGWRGSATLVLQSLEYAFCGDIVVTKVTRDGTIGYLAEADIQPLAQTRVIFERPPRTFVGNGKRVFKGCVG